jgi:hypothetical protein
MSIARFEASPGSTGTGPRQAALLLHAMTRRDREWLLGNLEPEQRSQLEIMLAEVHALGVPPVPAFVRDVLRSDEARELIAALRPVEPSGASVSCLGQLSPARAHAVLLEEPDSVVISVLSRTAGWWQSAVLDAFGVQRRELLQRALHNMPHGDRTSRRRVDLEIDARLIARCSSSKDSGLPKEASFRVLARRLRRIIPWPVVDAIPGTRT